MMAYRANAAETLNENRGLTIVMVTHDPHAAESAHKVLHLEKGQLLKPEEVNHAG